MGTRKYRKGGSYRKSRKHHLRKRVSFRNRRRHRKMYGGEPALIGDPWTSDINSWPGVSGGTGNSNHYPMNTYKHDFNSNIGQERAGAIYNGTGGGRRRRRSRKRGMKGGAACNSSLDLASTASSINSGVGSVVNAFYPQDLVNVGRSAMFSAGSVYNALGGYAPPVNPNPTSDQLVGTLSASQLKYL